MKPEHRETRKADAPRQNELLLAEYEAVNQSILHHENLIWTIGSVFNAIVLGTLTFSFKIEQPNTLLVPIFAAVCLYALWFLFECRYRQICHVRFDRARKIERALGMSNHVAVAFADEGRRFKPRAHLLIGFYCAGFPIALIAFYLYLEIWRS